MWSRSSDIRTLALGAGCELSLFLSWLYEQKPTTWFIRGSAVHAAIEAAITYDLGMTEAVDEAGYFIHRALRAAQAEGQEVLIAPRSCTTTATLLPEAATLIGTWFRSVHPDSPQRMAAYSQYDWPPIVEHQIRLSGSALYTTIDARFSGGPESRPVAIVDWKTGSKAYAPESQLQTYTFGGRREGWFPEDQETIGWFHHLKADKLQWAEQYWGDAVVMAWLDATVARKIAVTGSLMPVANPGPLCFTCPVRWACPIKGQGDWADLGHRIAVAQKENIPS